MYELFLESKAAEACVKYAARNPGVDAEELLQRAYKYTTTWKYNNVLHDSDWWVNACLDNDRHKRLGIGGAFPWAKAPEGAGFWVSVSNAWGR